MAAGPSAASSSSSPRHRGAAPGAPAAPSCSSSGIRLSAPSSLLNSELLGKECRLEKDSRESRLGESSGGLGSLPLLQAPRARRGSSGQVRASPAAAGSGRAVTSRRPPAGAAALSSAGSLESAPGTAEEEEVEEEEPAGDAGSKKLPVPAAAPCPPAPPLSVARAPGPSAAASRFSCRSSGAGVVATPCPSGCGLVGPRSMPGRQRLALRRLRPPLLSPRPRRHNSGYGARARPRHRTSPRRAPGSRVHRPLGAWLRVRAGASTQLPPAPALRGGTWEGLGGVAGRDISTLLEAGSAPRSCSSMPGMPGGSRVARGLKVAALVPGGRWDRSSRRARRDSRAARGLHCAGAVVPRPALDASVAREWESVARPVIINLLGLSELSSSGGFTWLDFAWRWSEKSLLLEMRLFLLDIHFFKATPAGRGGAVCNTSFGDEGAGR